MVKGCPVVFESDPNPHGGYLILCDEHLEVVFFGGSLSLEVPVKFNDWRGYVSDVGDEGTSAGD